MRRFRIGVLIVGALALVLAACSDGETSFVDIPKARTEILKAVDDVYGSQFEVGNVRCPEEVPLEQGLTFFCTVNVDGQALRINMRQTDDEGAVRFDQAQSVLLTPKVEEFVVSYLEKNGQPGSQASCGEAAVLIRTPGKEVQCQVQYADGTAAVATLGVKDTSGNTALISIEPSG